MGRLLFLPAGKADALIVGEVPEDPSGRADERNTLLSSDVLRTEPRTASATADHRVLVTGDATTGSLALRRNESGRGGVK
jgi:hypothetical protein